MLRWPIKFEILNFGIIKPIVLMESRKLDKTL